MEKLTREEIEMCEIAVGIVIDRLDLTSENKAKWEALFDRLEVLQRETCLTPLALDVAESPRKCTTEKLCPVHNVWHAAPPRK